MADKQAIIEVLGEAPLLLPQRLHDALDANARIKYLLSLLQLARTHADQPALAVPPLRHERVEAGIDDASLDQVPAASHRRPGGLYHVPHARESVARITDDLERMIRPLHENGPAAAAQADRFEGRLRALHLADAAVDADTLRGEAVAHMATADRGGPDSLHLLVMDVHKALNDLAARVATESVDGAQVYALDDEDRRLVAAFMRGVHQTEALKFGHPGLATTATRSGARLILQNDLGETEAHVVVVHLTGLEARVVTTDVHLPRIQFFRQLFRPYRLTWEDTHAQQAAPLGTELFYLCTGIFRAADAKELERFLTLLGSRLVFLIDWNRARKQLRALVPKTTALTILERAAVEGYGHRGFLELGGAALLLDALTAVLRVPFRFGERLDDVLGADAAERLLSSVLRLAAHSLLERRSRPLVRELVRVELAAAVTASGERLLGPVREHADLTRQLAAAVRQSTAALEAAPRAAREEHARHAKELERVADERVIAMRSLAERLPDAARYWHIIEAADDAADALEEAAFQLMLLPAPLAPAAWLHALAHLAALLVAASEAYARAAASARRAAVRQSTAEARAFLEAVDQVQELEHQTDDEQRRVAAALLAEPGLDTRLLLVASQVGENLEKAADALLHASLLMRTAVLGTVMAEQRR